MAILIGVAMALVVNRIFWPTLARKELRKRLSHTVQHISQLYSKIQASLVQGHFDVADRTHVRQLSAVVRVRACVAKRGAGARACVRTAS